VTNWGRQGCRESAGGEADAVRLTPLLDASSGTKRDDGPKSTIQMSSGAAGTLS